MFDEHVKLLERAGIHQKIDALARGQLAAAVLGLDALQAAPQPCVGAALFQLLKNVTHRIACLP